jgi:hypothetical protein
VEHAAKASAFVRESYGLEFDQSGKVMSFQLPMVVVRLEQAK